MTSKSITPHDLKIRCRRFLDSPFPDSFIHEIVENDKMEIDGVCIFSINSIAAGCLTRYVDGNSTPSCIHILKSCRDDIRSILTKIPTGARPYMIELQWLIDRIIERLS